jgi:hypothetical protein
MGTETKERWSLVLWAWSVVIPLWAIGLILGIGMTTGTESNEYEVCHDEYRSCWAACDDCFTVFNECLKPCQACGPVFSACRDRFKQWSMTECLSGPGYSVPLRVCRKFDIDNDGDVDLRDWAGRFHNTVMAVGVDHGVE